MVRTQDQRQSISAILATTCSREIGENALKVVIYAGIHHFLNRNIKVIFKREVASHHPLGWLTRNRCDRACVRSALKRNRLLPKVEYCHV